MYDAAQTSAVGGYKLIPVRRPVSEHLSETGRLILSFMHWAYELRLGAHWLEQV